MISFHMKITRATRVGKTLEHPETANLNRGERQQIITGHFRLYGYIRPFKQILQIFDVAIRPIQIGKYFVTTQHFQFFNALGNTTINSTHDFPRKILLRRFRDHFQVQIPCQFSQFFYFHDITVNKRMNSSGTSNDGD